MLKDSIILYITRFLRVFLKVLYVFPIKRNRILFCSTFGKKCICNPKYISDYLACEQPGKYEIVWAVRDDQALSSLAYPPNTVCKYHGVKHFYYMATSMVCIDNIGFLAAYKPRKGQMFINTWHGGGCYKNVGQAEKAITSAKSKREELSVGNTSVYLSSSRFFTEKVVREQFDFKGVVLEAGMPRNDCLVLNNRDYNEKVSRAVKKGFGIDDDVRIALYAPTWRYSNDNSIYDLDIDSVRRAFETRFGGKWVVLYRMHHRVHRSDSFGSEFAMDAGEYPDMQELLITADALITDYSSSMWDYSFTGRPCFLFTVDLEQYITERGFVKSIYEWGFPVCKDNQELFETIVHFDSVAFGEAMRRHHEDLGNCESGHACRKVAELIENHCLKE